jgi:hypothetical protein
MKQRLESMRGDVQKMLSALREEVEARRGADSGQTVALARIPGRRYALVKNHRS